MYVHKLLSHSTDPHLRQKINPNFYKRMNEDFFRRMKNDRKNRKVRQKGPAPTSNVPAHQSALTQREDLQVRM